MNFKNPPKLSSERDIVKFLQVDLWIWCKNLITGLTKLTFSENMETFEVVDVDIPAASEVSIPNGFRGRFQAAVPTKMMIVRQRGNGLVTDGQTPWNENFVYLYNNGAVPVTVSVVFFK